MTVGNVLKHRGVIEGGTGVMVKQKQRRTEEVIAGQRGARNDEK